MFLFVNVFRSFERNLGFYPLEPTRYTRRGGSPNVIIWTCSVYFGRCTRITLASGVFVIFESYNQLHIIRHDIFWFSVLGTFLEVITPPAGTQYCDADPVLLDSFLLFYILLCLPCLDNDLNIFPSELKE